MLELIDIKTGEIVATFEGKPTRVKLPGKRTIEGGRLGETYFGQYQFRENMTAGRAAAKRRIDAEAETIRSRYVTMGSGKALAYFELRDQALEVFSEVQSNPEAIEAKVRETWTADDLASMKAKYPMLVAELGFVSGSLKDMAQIVLDRYEQFRQAEADLIVRVREAKAAIDEADSLADLDLVHL